MKEYSIYIKPVEQLIFRRAGEFSPEARFLYGISTSYPLPQPSTLVGLIGWLIGSRPTSQGWIDEFKSMLEKTGVKRIRGPYLILGGRIYLWYRDSGYIRLDSREGISKYIKRGIRDIDRGCEDNSKEYIDMIKAPVVNTVGIHIGRGYGPNEDKKAREGYLYFQSQIDFKYLEKKYGDVYICFDIMVEESLEDLEERLDNKVVSIGGEQRKAILQVRNQDLPKLVDNRIETRFGDGEIVGLYLCSAAILDLSKNRDNLFKSVEESLKTWVHPIGELIDYRINIDLLGMGYNAARKIKRPVYRVIKPGSYIIVKLNQQITFRDIYWMDLGKASNIGYATLIPIKL